MKPFDFAAFAAGLEAHMARQDVRDNWLAAEMARIDAEKKIINRNELKTPEIKPLQERLKQYEPQARYRS